MLGIKPLFGFSGIAHKTEDGGAVQRQDPLPSKREGSLSGEEAVVISFLTSVIISVILSSMIKAQELLKDAAMAFLNIIYPKKCQGCNSPLDYKNRFYLCKHCLGKITINKAPFCIRCGSPLYGPAALRALCGKCISAKYNFDRAFSCCNYEGLIKELIHKFKYQRKRFLIHLFDELLSNFAKEYIDMAAIDMLVPVPLHRGRLQERGFDQSLLLSKTLSKKFSLPIFYNILMRKIDTLQQTRLDKRQRLNNIKGAFFIKDKNAFQGKRVLLIDDVFTTAATANECSGMLKSSGVKSVYLLTLARGL
jgi:competence protein ComFC